MTLWQTDMAALLTSAPSCWPMGKGHTQAVPQTSGAWVWLCTPCWLVDTRFRTHSLLHCLPRFAAGLLPCLIGCHHKPSAWLAVCWGRHLGRGWKRQSCWCTHGWPILVRHIITYTRHSTIHKKHSRINRSMLTRWCQHGQKKYTNTHTCCSILVRTDLLWFAIIQLFLFPTDNLSSQRYTYTRQTQSDPGLLDPDPQVPSSCCDLSLFLLIIQSQFTSSSNIRHNPKWTFNGNGTIWKCHSTNTYGKLVHTTWVAVLCSGVNLGVVNRS